MTHMFRRWGWIVAFAFSFAWLSGSISSQPSVGQPVGPLGHTWTISAIGEIESVGQPGELEGYYLIRGRLRLLVAGDRRHELIRFLEARRGTTVRLTVEGGTPE